MLTIIFCVVEFSVGSIKEFWSGYRFLENVYVHANIGNFLLFGN